MSIKEQLDRERQIEAEDARAEAKRFFAESTGQRYSSTPKTESVPRLALRVAEAAAALGVSEDHFHDHIAPHLRWVRQGRLKIVAVTELRRWLDETAESL